MKLKAYQEGVLRKLAQYLKVLGESREEAEAFVEFEKARGRQTALRDYPRDAWDQLNAQRLLPLHKEKDSEVPARYLTRPDGLGRSVPNICFKVPTGGGKTLLGAAALERIQADYFRRQAGLVLWIVPSDAIYRQTWKQLANREHPYRQMLERASGGRVKLLEKGDAFALRDVEGRLCVMLLMLPSAARKSKETLRMFRDSGKFASFFPPEDDAGANEKLLNRVPNLLCNDLADIGHGQGVLPGSVSIKQSLGNVLCLARPVIVLDEGHKAYSDTARDIICGFNPRFILELSATPNTNGKHQSNVLVNVPGSDLKDEQMIKLPINVVNEAKGGWKHTLALAHGKLAELAKEAEALRDASGRYIRPILLVRVERTGEKQRDAAFVHAEDARDYLLQQLGAKADEIRLKTSEKDELGDDDLLADTCKVRYIITKDALREGWDCPFAYVLAILSKTTAQTALTQMIGRVLRQPHARITERPPLDECYVYTFDQDVSDAIQGVRRGLEEEGMGDLSASVRAGDSPGGSAGSARRETLRRRAAFAKLPPIFLPRLLHRDDSPGAGKDAWRPLDYDRDILSELDWDDFHFLHPASYINDDTPLRHTLARINLDRRGRDGSLRTDIQQQDSLALPDEGIDVPFLVRQLLDVLPNPWQALRVLEEALAALRENGMSEDKIYGNRLDVVHILKQDVMKSVNSAAEILFLEKLNRVRISPRSVASGDPRLNWRLPETLDLEVTDRDRLLYRKDGASLEKNLFEKAYARDFNNLEKSVALYLDESRAVYWWHRIAVGRGSYSLQGWQRNKVYPDLLACLRDAQSGELRFLLLETKGDHLKDNDDTVYKRKLLDLMTRAADAKNTVGEMELEADSLPIRFRMLMEENWQATLAAEGV